MTNWRIQKSREGCPCEYKRAHCAECYAALIEWSLEPLTPEEEARVEAAKS